LAKHIPEMIACHSGSDLSFVAESPVSGKVDYRFGEWNIAFLRKLHDYSSQTMRFEESTLYRLIRTRMDDLSELLPGAWSSRLEKGIKHIEKSLTGYSIQLVAAHNDFAPWNVRVEHGIASVFDWEYAAYQHCPLFDPLHFALMPMALKLKPVAKIIAKMQDVLQASTHWFGPERCYKVEIQALTYCMNLCTLYLWADPKQHDRHPVIQAYAMLIDYLCRQSG
jgi:hypothetical protein